MALNQATFITIVMYFRLVFSSFMYVKCKMDLSYTVY